MKKVGIVVDNFKLKKFKSELTANGFKDFTTAKFVDETTSIMVQCPDDKVEFIAKLCKRLELHFKRSN